MSYGNRSHVLASIIIAAGIVACSSDDDKVSSPASGGSSTIGATGGSGSLGGAGGVTNTSSGGASNPPSSTSVATGGSNVATGGSNAASGGNNAATGGSNVASGGVSATGGATQSSTAGAASVKPVYLIDTGSASAAFPDLLPGIHVFNSVTSELIREVKFTDRKGISIGHFASLSPDGAYLWLCNDLGNVSADKGEVDIYETATLTITKQFKDVGCGVQNTRTHNGKYVFTSSTLTSKINVFDAVKQTQLGTIDIGSAPHVGDTSADDKTYFTTNAALGHALAYDISQLPTTLPTAPILDVEIDASGAPTNLHALRVHPNGKYLFVGAGAVGTNVIDIAAKAIVAVVPGSPHNYAISPDAKYLVSSELALDTARGTGERLQVIDISTLSTATPDLTKVKQVATLPHAGLGGSHEGWSPATGKLWYTLYSNTDRKGQLWVVDTSMLPDMLMVDKKTPIGDAPHGVVFPERND